MGRTLTFPIFPNRFLLRIRQGRLMIGRFRFTVAGLGVDPSRMFTPLVHLRGPSTILLV